MEPIPINSRLHKTLFSRQQLLRIAIVSLVLMLAMRLAGILLLLDIYNCAGTSGQEAMACNARLDRAETITAAMLFTTYVLLVTFVLSLALFIWKYTNKRN